MFCIAIAIAASLGVGGGRAVTGEDCGMQCARAGRGTGEMPSPASGRENARRPLFLAHWFQPVGGIVRLREAEVDCGRAEISRSTAPNSIWRGGVEQR